MAGDEDLAPGIAAGFEADAVDVSIHVHDAQLADVRRAAEVEPGRSVHNPQRAGVVSLNGAREHRAGGGPRVV